MKSQDIMSENSIKESINQSELTDQIKLLGERIKQTKHNLIHERKMNEMLREENDNLMETNKVLSKHELSTTTSTLPTNARVAENIYENFMINDLKAELLRIKSQINSSQSRAVGHK